MGRIHCEYTTVMMGTPTMVALLLGVTIARAALSMGKRCDKVTAVGGNGKTDNGCAH